MLSHFGIVPAALAGVNIEAMLQSAQVAEQNCAHFDSSQGNSGLWLGVVIGQLALLGATRRPSPCPSRSTASGSGSSS